MATDAIGMGLNLDLDHVAFAGMRKFDGQSHRNLTPAELGQIAGRAGRHMNDGTFGVTGQVAPFEAELSTGWRTTTSTRSACCNGGTASSISASIERLKDSLRETPDHRRLTRARMVDDVIALENVSHERGRARLGARTGRGRAAMGDVPDPRLPEDLRRKPCRAGRDALQIRHER